jgi:alkylhydroperoxidase family enzyme
MNASTRIPATEITGVFGQMMKIASRKMIGKVPSSMGVLWHNQRVLRDLMGIGRKSERWDELDPNLAALVAMATAAEIGCSFCLDFNYFLTRHRGLDETKARQVPHWRDSDAFTGLERRAMAYAEAMSQQPPAVTDEMSAELLDELGAAGLIELTARVALMNATARMNIALGIRSDEFADACGLPPLAARSKGVGSSA